MAILNLKDVNFYLQTLDELEQLICRYQADTTIIFANQAFCHYFKRYRDDLIGQPLTLLFAESEQRIFKAYLSTFSRQCPIQYIQHSGFHIDGISSYHEWVDKAFFDTAGEVVEFLSVGTDKKSFKHYEHTFRLSEKNNQNLGQSVQKEIARHKIHKESLDQSKTLITLGTLVSGVAHEINNPNNFILLNGKILQNVLSDIFPILETYYADQGEFSVAGLPWSEAKHELKEVALAVVNGSYRIAKIVQSLKQYVSSASPDLLQTVDLNQIIQSALNILQSKIEAWKVKIEMEMDPALPTIQGNFQQLEQVFINLIENSCQAMEKSGGSIIIISDYLVEANTARIMIRDTGIGIKEELINYITDPFFTTKRASGGTGLGLSLSLKIINQHSGKLTFQSIPGIGTTAYIHFPVLVDPWENNGTDIQSS